MNYNRNLWKQINRLTNEVTGSYRSYTPPEPPVVTDTVTITTEPTDITCYIGDTATLSIVAVSDDETATLSYQWQILDNETWLNVSGATESSYVVPTSGLKEDSYRCQVTSDKGGSATSTTATVTVSSDTVTISVQPQSATGNTGDVITLSVTASSDVQGATLSYQWQIKNGSTYDDISGATSSTYTVPTTTAGTQRYRVVITSDKGGTATSNYADITLVKQRRLSNNTDYKISWGFGATWRYATNSVSDYKISSTGTESDGAIFHVSYYGNDEYIIETEINGDTYLLAYESDMLYFTNADIYTWKDSNLSGTAGNTIMTYDGYYLVHNGLYLTLTGDTPTNIPTFREYVRPTDEITASIDTTRTTAPSYSVGYQLPNTANSYYYAVSASSDLGKTISYTWSWTNTSGYTSVVQLSGQGTDRVQLTLTNTNAPNNALAGYLTCNMRTETSASGFGATESITIPCFG